MPQLGKSSLKHYVNAHFNLQRVLKLAITRFDYTILCVYRNKADQEAAFKSGASHAHWLQSPHNFVPTLAADIAPFPINWGDTGTKAEREAALQRFRDLSAVMLQCGKELNVPITWGGDWDNNPRTQNHLNDFPHFELTNWRTLSQHHTAEGLTS